MTLRATALVIAVLFATSYSSIAMAAQNSSDLNQEYPDYLQVSPDDIARTAYDRRDVKTLTSLSRNNNAIAQFNLGVLYYNGESVSQSYSTASYWYLQSANQGLVNAQYALAMMYYDGKGINQDYAAAASWFRKAADQGHASSQFYFAWLLYSGKGVAQDHFAAARWFRKAADQGDGDAETNLAAMYHHGHGLPRDLKMAAHWMQRAAARGNARAQNSLGLAYRDGKGVPQDYVLALSWFQKSASQGLALASFNLNALYEKMPHLRGQTPLLSNSAIQKSSGKNISSNEEISPSHHNINGFESECVSYGFINGTEQFSNCLLQLSQMDQQARLQQQQYELQRRQYDQQVAAYEAQQRALKRERDRQRWETLARWGAGMAQSQSPSFGGALADANAAALGMPPVTKPPAPPPPPVFQNFTIRTASGSTVWCTYNAVVREVQCR